MDYKELIGYLSIFKAICQTTSITTGSTIGRRSVFWKIIFFFRGKPDIAYPKSNIEPLNFQFG